VVEARIDGHMIRESRVSEVEKGMGIQEMVGRETERGRTKFGTQGAVFWYLYRLAYTF